MLNNALSSFQATSRVGFDKEHQALTEEKERVEVPK
jgi:hypothetical protein